MVTELWCVQKVFVLINQRGITQKLFLCQTNCLDLIFISINYHEDILTIVYGPYHNMYVQFKTGV